MPPQINTYEQCQASGYQGQGHGKNVTFHRLTFLLLYNIIKGETCICK